MSVYADNGTQNKNGFLGLGLGIDPDPDLFLFIRV